MHPRAPSHVNKSNDTRRPPKRSDSERIWNDVTGYERKLILGTRIEEAPYIDVVYSSIFGSLRQAWACVEKKKMSPRPFALWKDGDQNPISSHPIWPCQREKSACIRPFRGVVQLLSRMESCIFNCCSVLTFGPHEGTLNRFENFQFNLTARIRSLNGPLSPAYLYS